ncbi:hypothetical protein SPFM8_00016 [Salmonella phage SPFM8]|nr:hypothetical protein SPFM8_00016 [Salmonella phage SPFM8]
MLVTYLLLLQIKNLLIRDGMSLWKIAHPDLGDVQPPSELISMSANDILAAESGQGYNRFKCLLQVELGDDVLRRLEQRFLDTITKGSSGRIIAGFIIFETIAEYPVEIIPHTINGYHHINQIGDVFTLSMKAILEDALGQDDIKPIPSDMKREDIIRGLMTALFFFDFGATMKQLNTSRCS